MRNAKYENIHEDGFIAGFNQIEPWLREKLEKRGLNVHSFARETDYTIGNTSLWRWFSDIQRPHVKTMELICDTLSRLPLINPDGQQIYEDVTLEEGLEQYRPKRARRRKPVKTFWKQRMGWMNKSL